ncbi:alpha/beta hydrolase [Nodularia spumigena]|uniref:alpha/beta hydrolase n=1 Tax=Nodularia spumigena TaxID=70799 RepID=UPI002B217CE0|nr:alpha/beta hydrolase [Nodularia spumigena]MEA5557630.1 alpha/beta hydrolase [Nodularia spumigena CH309]
MPTTPPTQGHPGAASRSLISPLALLPLLLAIVLLSGCQNNRLIDPPYVMRTPEARALYEALPERLQTPDIPIMYVTNRVPERQTPTGPQYGYKRSRELTFGVARVALSPEPTWPQLVDDSIRAPRSRHYSKDVSSVQPTGTFRPAHAFSRVQNGRIMLTDDGHHNFIAERESFEAAMDLWFGPGGTGPAYVYVHGYNNTFEDSVFRVAETWHFSARPGLPIAFSWPAGSGGLKGYAYDRESGEFSVVHLKTLIWMLANSPRIEEIHIISHSRGTDLATTALREIQFEIRGIFHRSLFGPLVGKPFINEVHPGTEPYQVLKVRTLVLAAPDMDLEVFTQRFFNEGLIHAAERIVVYTSERDGALGLSNWLFRGSSRLGDLKVERLDPAALAVIDSLPDFQLINCDVRGSTSHGYIFQHPAAFSDLILLLRDDLDPGPDTARPLHKKLPGIWQLENDYLKP